MPRDPSSLSFTVALVNLLSTFLSSGSHGDGLCLCKLV